MDVAILPPPDVSRGAIEYSAALPAGESQGLRLDADHFPHVTLTQQFIREEELERAFERVDEVIRNQTPLRLRVTGAESSGNTVWMAIERTPDLASLHERLMEALRGFERPEGGPDAFYEGEARARDVLWVTGFRLQSSFGSFTAHITLGHAAEPPAIQPFTFEATTVAACQLGRFCTCRRVLRRWELDRAA